MRAGICIMRRWNLMQQKENEYCKDMVMIRILPYILAAFILLEGPAFPEIQDDAAQALANADAFAKNIELNKDLGPYLPLEIYDTARADAAKARMFLNDKDYVAAYYHASIAAIGFETAIIKAQAKMMRGQAERLSSRHRNESNDESSLTKAKFEKKGNTYRTMIYDGQLFNGKKNPKHYTFLKNGKKRLDEICSMIKAHPAWRLKVVGHTAGHDRGDYSLRKAAAVKKYFIDNAIEPERIDSIGLGNKEVMATSRGYRRVDRIEFIITGLQ